MIVKVEDMDKLMAAIPNEGATAKYYAADGTFLLQELCVDKAGVCTWKPDIWKYEKYSCETDSETGIKTGIYEFRFKDVVLQSSNPTVLNDLFTHITVPGEINNTQLANLKDVKIVVNAHAIQADGFRTDDAAWAAFDSQNDEQ